jgi:hypothetical protein
MPRGRPKKQPKFSGELNPEQQKTKQQRIHYAVVHGAQQLELASSAVESLNYRAKLIQEDYGYPASKIKKLAKMKFKKSKDKLIEETEEITAEYEIYVEAVKEDDEEQGA